MAGHLPQQVLYLKPLSDEIKKEILKAKKVVVVENNVTGQLGRLIREKTGIYSHYSISVEGVVELKTENNSNEKILVDILGTCTPFKDLYGNLWVEFYNASKKWQDYFLGNNKLMRMFLQTF